MNVLTPPSRFIVARASASREFLSHRLNRFLYAHVALVGLAGLLPLFTPGEALARGAAWWLLHAVLYAISLSAFLLGLSSAHAEAEEFAWLLGQPGGVGPWLAGKAVALTALLGVSSALLALPTALAGGGSKALLIAAAGAAGVSGVCGLAGLAIGFWIRDPVRGLIAAIAAWLAFLFGTDLVLLAVAGAPFSQRYPDLWVASLMANPLDAFRVTILFSVERAAFSELNAGRLASWWVANAPLWLAIIFMMWASGSTVAAWLGARRRIDG